MLYDIGTGILQDVAILDTGIFSGQFIFNGTAGIQIPAGTTAQESVTANGTIRYNTDLNRIRARVNGSWQSLVGAPVPITDGGTALTSIGAGNSVLGVNNGATALEYKTLVAGSNISIVHGVGSITINSALAVSDQAILQVRRVATTALNTTFTNITWDTQDEENNTSVIEWTSGANITVKEAGAYLISYLIPDNNTSTHTTNVRVRKNATTVINGSSNTYTDGSAVDFLTNQFVATLAAYDTLQFQVSLGTGTFTGCAGITFSVIRLRGAKGDPGLPGPTGAGSNVNILNGGSLIAGSPFSALNFAPVANLIVANAGSGRANITFVPSGNNTNIQWNNSGVLAGSDAFNFITGANPRVAINGTASTTQLSIGGMTQNNNATAYIENVGAATSEAMRCYFNRQSAGINGWITWNYDQSTPNFRITDEDDDPPYVQFVTVGTGTYDSPQYLSLFGARGTYSSRTSGNNAGFAWHIGSATNSVDMISTYTPVMELDSQWLRVPSGTTAQRPTTPAAGMIRYNSATSEVEAYQKGNWQPWESTLQVLTSQIAQTSTTALIPHDNTPPLNTEGTQFWTDSITPRSTTSRILLQSSIMVSSSTSGRYVIVSVFRGSNLIGVGEVYINSSNTVQTLALDVVDHPASVSAQTYSMRFGSNSASTSYVARPGGVTFGGSASVNNSVILTELR